MTHDEYNQDCIESESMLPEGPIVCTKCGHLVNQKKWLTPQRRLSDSIVRDFADMSRSESTFHDYSGSTVAALAQEVWYWRRKARGFGA
jgi:hypothetical protein